MPRLGRTLASRILVAVLGIVVTTMAVGFALFARLTTHAADARAIEQATGIAVTLGRVPEVAQAVQDGDRGSVLERLGEQVRAGTSASYVVIIDRDGIRHSHPNPSLIGQHIEEPVAALDGRVHTGIDEGSLGVKGGHGFHDYEHWRRSVEESAPVLSWSVTWRECCYLRG